MTGCKSVDPENPVFRIYKSTTSNCTFLKSELADDICDPSWGIPNILHQLFAGVTFEVTFKLFDYPLIDIFPTQVRNAWMTNPLLFPAVAMLRGVVCFSVIRRQGK